MCRGELKLRECPTDMEIIIKDLVRSFPRKVGQNKMSVTSYGHGNHHEASDLSSFRQFLNKSNF